MLVIVLHNSDLRVLLCQEKPRLIVQKITLFLLQKQEQYKLKIIATYPSLHKPCNASSQSYLFSLICSITLLYNAVLCRSTQTPVLAIRTDGSLCNEAGLRLKPTDDAGSLNQ